MAQNPVTPWESHISGRTMRNSHMAMSQNPGTLGILNRSK